MTIAVVTDSTADLSKELAEQYGITVVPLFVHFGNEAYRDGVDITAAEFYERLQSGNVFPTTSAPSAGAFIDVYRELGKNHDGIISLHLSSKVSATYSAARLGADGVKADGITVEAVDTLQASAALGLIAIEVAKEAQAGKSLPELVTLAKSLSERAVFTGLVETLEYLHKGGRIGKAQQLLGSLLKIKPILQMVDGEAAAVDRARTRGRGIERIKKIIADSAPLQGLAILHATDPDIARQLAVELAPYAPDGKPIVMRMGVIVGAYLGPGMLGFGLIKAR